MNELFFLINKIMRRKELQIEELFWLGLFKLFGFLILFQILSTSSVIMLLIYSRFSLSLKSLMTKRRCFDDSWLKKRKLISKIILIISRLLALKRPISCVHKLIMSTFESISPKRAVLLSKCWVNLYYSFSFPSFSRVWAFNIEDEDITFRILVYPNTFSSLFSMESRVKRGEISVE